MKYIYVTYEQFAYTPEDVQINFFETEKIATEYLLNHKNYVKDDDGIFSNDEEYMRAYIEKHKLISEISEIKNLKDEK